MGTNMHRIVQDFAENDSRVLDRLVDGELTELERQELLSALDDEPAGWRRCALAFLESQFWGNDLKTFRDQPLTPVTPARSHTHLWRQWPVALAMAASLAIAFFIGLALQGQFGGDSNTQQLAQDGNRSTMDAQQLAHATAKDATKQNWTTIQLTNDDGSVFDVKAFDAANGNLGWLFDATSAVPADVLQQLQQRGHSIQRETELWPVQLKDGRRLIVPIEQVQVHYVSHESYQ
jgi:surface antigen